MRFLVLTVIEIASLLFSVEGYSQVDTGYTHCQNLILDAEALDQSQKFQEAYVAYRTYIESCAYLSNSWMTFTDVGSMNASRTGGNTRFAEYRDWLKKVLYLNLDSNYYCADVSEMLGTFSWFNDQRGNDYKGLLSLGKYIMDSSKCRNLASYIKGRFKATWDLAYETWADSVRNPTLTPFDSTLPSLDDLDLGLLRSPPADVKKFIDATSGPIIANIHALENPFNSETKIAFTTREAVALKFEVYDVLGKKVFDGGNKVYDKGEVLIVLPGTGLPHGELFGRFSASDGTVKTIKLQHIE